LENRPEMFPGGQILVDRAIQLHLGSARSIGASAHHVSDPAFLEHERVAPLADGTRDMSGLIQHRVAREFGPVKKVIVLGYRQPLLRLRLPDAGIQDSGPAVARKRGT